LTCRVLLHPRAAKFLFRSDENLQSTIKDSLRDLRDSPETKGDRLTQSVFRRIRIGDYRAIYEIDMMKKRVVVLYIGHRKGVYDDFSRLF